MADEKYLANRLKYHTASRIATQTGEALAQALNVDGHIVTTNKVWAAPQTAFINNVNKANTDSVDATNDLVAAFKTGAVSGAFWNGGTVWTNELYPAVKLYENVPMTVVKGSDGGGKFQAFEVLAGDDGVSTGTKRIVDWIAPTAVADQTTGAPVAGYSGIPMYNGTALKLADTTKWAEAGGHYEFAYIAGMLTFEPGFTPQDKAAAAVNTTTGKTYITLTAFKYVGEYLDSNLSSLKGADDALDLRLDAVEAQLFGDDEEGSGSTVPEQIAFISGVLKDYTTEGSVSGAIKAEESARIAADDYISGVVSSLQISGSDAITVSPTKLTDTPVISLNVAEGSNAIDITNSGLSSFLEFGKVGSTISLKANGNTIGSFNLDIDRVVTSGAYIPSSEVLKLSFTSGDDVEIPVGELVDEYSAGSAIFIDDNVPGKNVISVVPGSAISVANNKVDVLTGNGIAIADNKLIAVSGTAISVDETGINVVAGKGITLSGDAVEVGKSANSEEFFFVNETGVGVSGIQDAIDKAKKEITDVYATTGYVDTQDEATLELAKEYADDQDEIVSGQIKEYVDSTFLSGIVKGTSNAQALSISTKSNATTISLQISDNGGNAIVDSANGLFVQGYKEGENIAFSTDNDGLMTINGTYEYVLSAATNNVLGGVKSGGDILVSSDGSVEILSSRFADEAGNVTNALTFGSKSFNGSETAQILASDIISIISGGTSDALSITSSTTAGKEQYVVSLDESLIVGTKATTGLTFVKDTDIYAWDAIKTLDIAIAAEATARGEADAYISGVLKGYTDEGAVKAADEALDLRLDAVEAQLFGDDEEGSGSTVPEQIAFISGVLKDYTTEGSVSGAIKAEESARIAADDAEALARATADTYISGVLKGYTTEGAVKAADDAEALARATADTYISGVLKGYTTEGAVKDADDALAGRITSLENIKIQKDATAADGFAATYRLTDGSNTFGELINIPRDQFLSGAMYDTTDQSLKLTFALSGIDSNGFQTISSHVATIPVGDLVDEYSAGSGIQFITTDDGKNTFNLVKDTNEDSKFLVIGNDTIGLSGISDAISEVSTQVTENINPAIDFLSGVLSGYSEVSAVSSAITTVDGKVAILNSDVNTSGSVKYAVYNEAATAKYVNISNTTTTISGAIAANETAIATLNGDVNTSGSVKYEVATGIEEYDDSISDLISIIEGLNNQINGQATE